MVFFFFQVIPSGEDRMRRSVVDVPDFQSATGVGNITQADLTALDVPESKINQTLEAQNQTLTYVRIKIGLIFFFSRIFRILSFYVGNFIVIILFQNSCQKCPSNLKLTNFLIR